MSVLRFLCAWNLHRWVYIGDRVRECRAHGATDAGEPR